MSLRARFAYTFLTGYMLTFYSKWMFWSGRPPSETFFLEAIPGWIAYSFIIFLTMRISPSWVTFMKQSTVSHAGG